MISQITKSLKEMNLSPFSLVFRKNEQKKYSDEIYPKEVESKRIGIIVGIILYIMFAFIDYMFLPHSKYLLWFIRFGVFIPVALLVYMLTYIDRFNKYLSISVSIVSFVAGATSIVGMMFMPAEVIGVYHFSVICFLVYNYLLMNVEFLPTFISLTSTLACYIVYMLSYSPIIWQEKLTGILITTTVWLFSSFGAYIRILEKKSKFFDSIKLKSKAADFWNSQGIDVTDNTNHSNSKEKGGKKSKDVKSGDDVKIRYVEAPINRMFEEIEDVVWFVSEKGDIKYISKSIKDFLGYEPEDLIDKKFLSIVTNESYLKFQDAVERFKKDKNKAHMVIQYKTKASLVRYGESFIKPYSDKRFGEGYFASTRLITDEKAKSLDFDEKEFSDLKELVHDLKQDKIHMQTEITGLQNKLVKMSEIENATKHFPLSKISDLLLTFSDDLSKNVTSNLNTEIKATNSIANKFVNAQMMKNDLEGYFLEILKSSTYSSVSTLIIAKNMELFALYLNDNIYYDKKKINVKPAFEKVFKDLSRIFEIKTIDVELQLDNDLSAHIDDQLFDLVFQNIVIMCFVNSLSQIKNGFIKIETSDYEQLSTLKITFNGKKLMNDISGIDTIDYIEDNSITDVSCVIKIIQDILLKHANVNLIWGIDNDINEIVFEFNAPN